ncbi:MAG TPA: hypothetical protein V6C65_36605, partial [Allocoleopsis sp.]
ASVDTLPVVTSKLSFKQLGGSDNAFERKMGLLLAGTNIDAVVVVKLFLKGLSASIRQSVMRNVLQDPVKFDELSKLSARAAVVKLIEHAQRCEHIDQFIASSNTAASIRTAAVVDASPASSPVGVVGAKQAGATSYGSDFHVKKLASRYKLATSVVQARLKKSQCVVCGVSGHIARACRSQSSTTGNTAVSPKEQAH